VARSEWRMCHLVLMMFVFYFLPLYYRKAIYRYNYKICRFCLSIVWFVNYSGMEVTLLPVISGEKLFKVNKSL
jgi:hypothetical protein